MVENRIKGVKADLEIGRSEWTRRCPKLLICSLRDHLAQVISGDESKSVLHELRLNTDLAKKPRGCLEYIVVHEMAHLLEPTHSARFVALMDQLMPKWQFHRQALNRLPVRHESGTY